VLDVCPGVRVYPFATETNSFDPLSHKALGRKEFGWLKGSAGKWWVELELRFGRRGLWRIGFVHSD